MKKNIIEALVIILVGAVLSVTYAAYERCFIQVGGTNFRLVHPNHCTHENHAHERNSR